ncbi:MAG TPA: tetratricopeptide repeat protein [Parafilimonas sp.]|nr:tetratricopeptide repeat protein [Parafilimonas sp.]
MKRFRKELTCNLYNKHSKNFALYIKVIACGVFFLFSATAYNQDAETDSLLRVANKTNDDSLKVNALISLASANSLSDSGIAYANRAKDIAFKIGFKTGEAYGYKWLSIINNNKGDYYNALVNSNKSLAIFESLGDKVGTSNLLNNIGAFYADKGEDSKAIEYYLRSLDLAQQTGNKLRIETALSNIGVTYFKDSSTKDKALEYYLKALPYALQIKDDESTGIIFTNIGEVYAVKNDFDQARYYYKKALSVLGESSSAAYTYNDLGKLAIKQKAYDLADFYLNKADSTAQKNNSPIDILQSLIGKAQLQVALDKTKDAITLFNKAVEVGKPLESSPELKEVYEGLSSEYQKINDYKNAFLFQRLLNEVYKSENAKKLSFNSASLQYTMELQKQSGQIAVLIQENEQQELTLAKAKLARNVLIGGLAIVLVFVVLLFINTTQRKKLNKILFKQKAQIEAQKISVEKTLNELKSTQSQLIYAEKMASLGELTAGVAHEIQNPLNFVNNFSEVNIDLIVEMKQEIENKNYAEAIQIATDIEKNARKINHHGKRADAIVKGMIQHSRASSSQKELTDINGLADEYLRLCYHGIKVKEKDLNVTIKPDFDKTIGQINIIPQDIGRVLLNLYNNAFYAVNEKKKTADEDYKPLVSVQTKKINDAVEIIISDNGNGIPQNIIDKIFQPFFTTKPTGEGTGLGLSLSYDIIKVHGGEIKVETKEGEGTTFIIQLPLA